MLASRLIKRRDMDKTEEKKRGIVALGDYLAGKYQWVLHRALDAPLVVIVIALMAGGGALALLPTIPQELTPPEDRAVALMRISAPQGVSLEYTRARMIEIERLVSRSARPMAKSRTSLPSPAPVRNLPTAASWC